MRNNEIPSVSLQTFGERNIKLAYANEFRQMLRRHPGVVKSALQLSQRAEQEYNPGDFQYFDYTLRWNKEINNWQTVAYDVIEYDEPGNLGEAIWGRGA